MNDLILRDYTNTEEFEAIVFHHRNLINNDLKFDLPVTRGSKQLFIYYNRESPARKYEKGTWVQRKKTERGIFSFF